MKDCVFCGIEKENIPHHEIIWSDADYLAFLDSNPSKEGHTLVIPKEHKIGILGLSETQFEKLFLAARKVALLLKQRLNCDNVAIVTEGSSIPHTHVHLIPLLRGEKLARFSNEKKTAEELVLLANRIRG